MSAPEPTTLSVLDGMKTYIGKCCREWVLVAGVQVGRCGICNTQPQYLRDDD